MSIYSKEFLEKTISAWEPLTASSLSFGDAEEIIQNAVGLFSLLAEWHRTDGEREEYRKSIARQNLSQQTFDRISGESNNEQTMEGAPGIRSRYSMGYIEK